MTTMTIEENEAAAAQERSDVFELALGSWQQASSDLEKRQGDDKETGRLLVKTSLAVDTLLATPAQNIAGVLAKLDSMWHNGGEWSNDEVHRAQIICDLESLTVRADDTRSILIN